jgi:hypothetical protein
MNGFQAKGRGISAHERASTGGKKTANSIVGKTMRDPASEEARVG